VRDALPHGFKSDAERLAETIRSEYGISLVAPIDCESICQDLGIPVIPLTEVVAFGARPDSVAHLMSAAARFSALTVCAGTKRLIVYNPAQPAGRRSSSLAHELSHIVLEHPISPALGIGGCRRWDARLEAEADWQAAALLVPRLGALRWMRDGGTIESGAIHFGVSTALFGWRVNQTGVIRQLSARAALLRGQKTA
jgi:Zn-dependent peptidase ImmA (M78 family)